MKYNEKIIRIPRSTQKAVVGLLVSLLSGAVSVLVLILPFFIDGGFAKEYIPYPYYRIVLVVGGAVTLFFVFRLIDYLVQIFAPKNEIIAGESGILVLSENEMLIEWQNITGITVCGEGNTLSVGISVIEINDVTENKKTKKLLMSRRNEGLPEILILASRIKPDAVYVAAILSKMLAEEIAKNSAPTKTLPTREVIKAMQENCFVTDDYSDQDSGENK